MKYTYKKPVSTVGNTMKKAISDTKTPASKKVRFYYLLAILCLVLVAYSNIGGNQFLNWDDPLYVTENPDISSLKADNIKAFFTKDYVQCYLPLTMISFAINYKIDKLNPKVYTYTNLLLHFLNACLVFWFILQLFKNNDHKTYWIAGLTAILFAIHPLQVESVAWVSERKNVLFTFFFLLSLITYDKYLVKQNYRFLIYSLLFFTASLLSKSVAVSLAFCVLILDIYNERKIFSLKVMLEKTPFFLLSLIFGIVTIYSQKQGDGLVGSIDNSIIHQLVYVSYAFLSYLFKLLIPVNISAFYAYPQSPEFIHYLSLILVLVLAGFLIINRKKISRLTHFGILFFLANIVFVIQIIPVGDALMADRYIYVSSIGYFLILAIGIQKLAEKFKPVYLATAIYLIIFAFLTHYRVTTWNNSLSFWNKIIEKDKNVTIAWFNRGVVKLSDKDYEGALFDFNNAIALKPNMPKAYNNKALALQNLKRYTEAFDNFSKAIEIDSNYISGYFNRAILLNLMKDYTGALKDLDHTLLLNPKYLEAYIGRAKINNLLKNYNQAISNCNSAIELNHSYAEAYSIKALAYYRQADYKTAINVYNEAIKLSSSNITNYLQRGASYYYIGEYASAISDMNVVIRNLPEKEAAYYIRGISSVLSGSKESGCNDLKVAASKGYELAVADLEKYCK